MRIELITTGSELLLGFTVNTHVHYLARKLAERGLRLARQTTVGDDREEMRAVVTEALQRSDLILITGGLGPTSDDFTRDVVADVCGRKLLRDEAIAATIAERFRKRGIHQPESVDRQALVPEGATVLPNRNGTAAGLLLTQAGRQLFLLPGPPRELKPMFEEQVLPLLPRAPAMDCRIFKVVGLGESQVEEMIGSSLADLPDLEVGYCARMGEVEVRVISRQTATAAAAEQHIRAALGANIFGVGDDRLEDAVIRLLIAQKKTVATAESCTGGLIANRLTNVSGSSAAFLNGWVTYSNAAKVRDLGVRPATLEQYGAVSEPVAREMAEGARQRSGTDFALSVTGIAGPAGGTTEKPVGLAYIGCANSARTVVLRQQWLLDRETFKFFVAQTALDMLRRELRPAISDGLGQPALPTKPRAQVGRAAPRAPRSSRKKS